MKKLLYPVILSGFLSLFVGCAAPQIGPKPNIAPVSQSNAATRASIKATRASISAARSRIKESQAHSAKGATALEKADSLLSQMLKK